MDNIDKKSLIQKCTSISEWVLFAFPLLVDLIGFISLFTNKLQTWINDNIGTLSCVLIIVIVNVVLLANIIFAINKKATQKADKATEFIKGYKGLLKKYSDYLIAFESHCEEISSIDELYRSICECLKTIVDEVEDILHDITGSKVRVCIKSFPEKYEHKDVAQMELMTFCRSDKSQRESELERQERVRVDENTDFKLIMLNTYPYFAFNNLENFKNETGTEYENSTERWENKYKATIVYPISRCVATKRGKDIYQVLGFICVDTLSLEAFSADIGPMCIKFIESLSYLLYVFLDKCIVYRERIESHSSSVERECVNHE